MTIHTERGQAQGSHEQRTDAASEVDYGRQPPQDVAAEQSVLGGMLLSKDAIADVLEKLRPHDFYRPNHQSVYEAILDLYGRGEPADAVTVAAELDRRGQLRRVGGAPYLHTLISTVPTAANAGYYAGIVAEKALLRRLVEAGTRVVQYGYAGAEGADVAEVVDRAQAEVYDVTDRRMSEDYVALEELLQPTMDEIDAIASAGGISKGVPTGFTDLDEITNGLHPGQMIIVAARPGVGKALALDTPLPTPTGWTTMGEVEVGEQLLCPDGTSTRITHTTDIMTGRPCYEVEFDYGAKIIADEEHQWPTADGIRTTAQLRPGIDTIAATRPLDLKPIEHLNPGHPAPVHPFGAGAFLGGDPHYSNPAGAAAAQAYLRGSREQREAVLTGLLETAVARVGIQTLINPDGTLSIPEGPHPAQITDLLASLGYITDHRSVDGTIAFRPGPQPLPHHDLAEAWACARTTHVEHSHQVIAVRRIDSVPVRCVQVEHPDHLYLAGRAMIPTHNSTLGLDFVRSCSIKHQLPSVIFSLEMSKTEIVMRLLSAEAKIKLGDMRSGRMSDDDWTRLARRMSEISEAPLYIDDSPNLTMMEIRAKARRLNQKAGLKLVVVDYLQLMTSGKKHESRQQEVSEFSRNLKLLAKELDVPVVAISQLNRGPEQRTDKRPQVSDLRESGSLEQDADMVILLHRPDAFERDDPRGGEADLILGKHRNGPTATITVAHQLHLSRFANMAK
ncbi:DnaB domain-containing protein [Mycobacteroides abscessus subsp. abscessus]|uniref:replicative DNA helicase n=1 Tax=Mycobacteroides abscessus TaxID=36809 RepID=UPI00092828DF|nr:replicative DNA helicase [Mycobacteroides abscessus]SIC63315.1 DnaB domain-containing protein [Mycobacteroides abscessus subsp. abscessus]SIC95184.1 DnaB domain-containing protein [Mycobacteroides abscessus subsp. abscessus]SID21101.1 DnaB domain-containing protein [Mycobacteroides abscessus subsp. abscessus]SKV98433.1 DnaB domain-containing protein [Mycobacteroides abscessus subsp. abscessus]SKW05166.1 DnaB domain-containing protein [Mycobacteroides abscessus subsp. abscessus]